MFTTTLCAIALSTLLTIDPVEPTPDPPPCKQVPPDASPELQSCMSMACSAFQATYAACTTQPCRSQAWLQYALALIGCDTVEAYIDTNRFSTTPWVMIWTLGDEQGFAYEEKDVPNGAKVLFF